MFFTKRFKSKDLYNNEVSIYEVLNVSTSKWSLEKKNECTVFLNPSNISSDSFQIDKLPYSSLIKLQDSFHLNPSQLIDLLLPLFHTLHKTHHVIHGDVHANNFVFHSSGRPYLIDFENSSHHSDEEITKYHRLPARGVPAYMGALQLLGFYHPLLDLEGLCYTIARVCWGRASLPWHPTNVGDISFSRTAEMQLEFIEQGARAWAKFPDSASLIDLFNGVMDAQRSPHGYTSFNHPSYRAFTWLKGRKVVEERSDCPYHASEGSPPKQEHHIMSVSHSQSTTTVSTTTVSGTTRNALALLRELKVNHWLKRGFGEAPFHKLKVGGTSGRAAEKSRSRTGGKNSPGFEFDGLCLPLGTDYRFRPDFCMRDLQIPMYRSTLREGGSRVSLQLSAPLAYEETCPEESDRHVPTTIDGVINYMRQEREVWVVETLGRPVDAGAHIDPIRALATCFNKERHLVRHGGDAAGTFLTAMSRFIAAIPGFEPASVHPWGLMDGRLNIIFAVTLLVPKKTRVSFTQAQKSFFRSLEDAARKHSPEMLLLLLSGRIYFMLVENRTLEELQESLTKSQARKAEIDRLCEELNDQLACKEKEVANNVQHLSIANERLERYGSIHKQALTSLTNLQQTLLEFDPSEMEDASDLQQHAIALQQDLETQEPAPSHKCVIAQSKVEIAQLKVENAQWKVEIAQSRILFVRQTLTSCNRECSALSARLTRKTSKSTQLSIMIAAIEGQIQACSKTIVERRCPQ
eukprot:gnl/Dysnectes_brevis/7308_a12139_227.p1 GENE.gnl/Dysnectes_brevis/7308_a12139_227~~gnl/Dysnectes_brevis/7308_a12139_227.p1  ORF type:complete len:747 (+),score=12.51 gnl/Dysnectes_brevis/7308_a12139_227:99-2339(+)